MEFAFLFILLGITFGVITVMNKIQDNPRRRCNEIGVKHVWITKGIEGNTYLVCEKCGLLPSGETEERGGPDF